MTSQNFLVKFRDKFARFRKERSAKTHGFGTMPKRSATSYPQKVRRCVARFRPVKQYCFFQVKKRVANEAQR